MAKPTVCPEVIFEERTFEMPKSPILSTVRFLLSITFCVLRSRCRMLTEWMCSMATNSWAKNCRMCCM